MSKPSIVFCHGIWADGSCFNKVVPALQADGHDVIAVQYGLDTFAEDVAAVKRTLGRVSSPAILVGHSYGGATITAAGMDDRVKKLVYIAAVAHDTGETRAEPARQVPYGNIQPHCSRRRPRLVAFAGRHQVFRGRPSRAGAEGRVGHPLRARRRLIPATAKGRWPRLEVETELVHRRQE
jgi:pimeloyl-ACP methyl ester carboxylesterase